MTPSTTEITIDPSGRVFSFGTSEGVLEILLHLDPENPRLRALHRQLTGVAAAARLHGRAAAGGVGEGVEGPASSRG